MSLCVESVKMLLSTDDNQNGDTDSVDFWGHCECCSCIFGRSNSQPEIIKNP